MRLFRLLIIAIVCLVMVPRAVAAQVTNRVSITTAVGFDNVYFADSWTPVRITIDDIPIDMPVTIEWVVTADSQPTITWQRALALQAGTPVTIDTVMVMPSSARSIIARVRSSEGIIASTQIDAQVAVGQLNVIVTDQTTLATTFTSTVSVDGSCRPGWCAAQPHCTICHRAVTPCSHHTGECRGTGVAQHGAHPGGPCLTRCNPGPRRKSVALATCGWTGDGLSERIGARR